MAEYCSDEFKIIEDNEDSFRMWQGLVGPHYTPYISADGTLSFGNNGGLPNPSPVNLRGPQGAGIRIAGIVSTESALPVTAATGDIWLVGDETPYEGFSFIDGQWIDLGPLAVGPAGPPGPQGDDYILQESDKQEIAEIAEQVLLTELDETPLAIRYGGTGSRTVAGAKQALGIDEIESKLGTWPLGTDAQDVAGAVNEMIGEIVLQVDDIRKLKDDLAAEFNPNLTYAKGTYCVYGGNFYICHTAVTTAGSWTGDTNWAQVTVGGQLEANEGDVADLKAIVGNGELSGFTATDLTGAANELKNTLNHLEDGLAIIVNGDTCSTAVPVGGYAYIKNNTHGLAEGLYTNTSASAFPTSGGTANSSVFTAVSGGGLNSLKNSFVVISGTTNSTVDSNVAFPLPNGFTVDNTIIVSVMFYLSDAWRPVPFGVSYSDLSLTYLQATITGGNVYIVTRGSAVTGVPVKILLYRY